MTVSSPGKLNLLRDVSDLLMAVEGLAEGDIIASAAIDQEQP